MTHTRFMHILHAVYCEPWLIRPEMHAEICRIVNAHVDGTAHEQGGVALTFEKPPTTDNDMVRITDDGIGIVSISGVMGQHVDALEKMSGITDVAEVAEAVETLAADGAVRGMVLAFDSPGGTVTGVPELAATIRQARDVKPVVAFTDSMMASAAYWAGSQAYTIMATESAVLGSIGVYLPVLDSSRQAEMMGLKQEVIQAGRFKGAGVPGTSLTSEQREELQGKVNYLHDQFRAGVRSGRGIAIADEHMEGQDFFGKQAVAIGMADQIGNMRDAVALASRANTEASA